MYTVNILIGPSCCGKSHYANQLKSKYPQIQVVSSDEERRFLTGNLHKHDRRMMEVSKQAFSLLFAKLENLMSYPVHCPYIIVDSTGLSPAFRQDIINLCKKLHYGCEATIFRYDRQDYFKFAKEGDKIGVIKKHIKILNENPPKSGDFKKVHRVKSPDFQIPEITFDQAKTCNIEEPCLVVGDIHGQYNLLVELIEKAGGHVKDGDLVAPFKLVCIGDLIDKAPNDDCEKVVDFVLKNGISVRGNHEHFFKYIVIDNAAVGIPADLINKYFSCTLSPSEQFTNKVKALYESSYDFIRAGGYILTHSPCEKRYLGRHDTTKQQRNWRHFHLSEGDAVKTLSSMLIDDDEGCYPTHIFGHVEFTKVEMGKSWIALDTGAGDGGMLSGVLINSGKRRVFSVGQKKTFISILKDQPPKEILDPKTRAITDKILQGGVNFISGTMSPSEKLDNELESIKAAALYYSKFADKVFITPKMMGSRAQAYITQDEVYCISRGGFKVKTDGLNLLPKPNSFYLPEGVKLRILDCELMPWSFLGKGLIDQNFLPAYNLPKRENELCIENGFYAKLASFPRVYDEDFKNLSKKEFASKHGAHIYESVECFYRLKNIVTGPETERHQLEVYYERLKQYTGEYPPFLYPFSILKDVYSNGYERVYGYGTNNEEVFRQINDGPYLVCDVQDVESMEKFFYQVGVEQKLEGVVMRPITQTEGCAPYLKIRNPDYLTLAYGYDYRNEAKYAKLLNRKNTSRKLRQSILDYEAGLDMLNIPYDEIQGSQMRNLVARFVSTEKKGIDPRL